MKSIFTYTLVTIFFLAANVNAATILPASHPPGYKKVVLVKPARPHVRVYKPTKIKAGYIWINGHWQWNKRTHNYIWVKGRLVKRKNRKIWVSGYWKPVKGGWVYKSGKWA